MIAVAPEHEAALRTALECLDRIVAHADQGHKRVVMNCLRLRAALGLGPPPVMSPLARALATLEDETCNAAAFEIAVSVLEPIDASHLLRSADRYVAGIRARVLDEVVAAHALRPGHRLAAELALFEPARCEVLLARIHAMQPDAYVDLVAAAYLALVDRDREVPPRLAARWSAIVDTPDAWPGQSERFSARLRGLARRDAVAALAELASTIVEIGADDIPVAVMAVLSRAVRIDHAAAWTLGANLEWIDARALAIEALVVGAPDSPELDAALDGVLNAWLGGGWRIDTSELGIFQVSTPLLGACAAAGRLDLARRVIDTFDLSVTDIAESSVAGTRLRFRRTGDWRPGLPNVEISDPTVAATWMIETLPLLDLPWVEYEDSCS